jgi:hypothetical protein
MDSTSSFVVFYSNYCDHSKEFLVKLKNMRNGLFEKFTKICVDHNQSIPKSINSVPTILVPSHTYPLTDSGVFMWLDSMSSQYANHNPNYNPNQMMNQGEMPKPEQIHNREGINTNSFGPGQPSHVQTQNQSENNDGVAPYIAGEMGSCFSDSFSFLEAEPLGGQPLAHTFTFLGETDDSNMTTNNSEIDRPNVTNNQKASSGFDVAYEKYMSNRDADPYVAQAPKRAG